MNGTALQFLGSLAAVVVLVALTYFLGFRQSAKLASEGEAAELFRLSPGGFEPATLALGEDGQTAIARDASGRLAVLLPHGNHFVVRPVPKAARMTANEGWLLIAGRPEIRILLGESARDWAATDRDANRA